MSGNIDFLQLFLVTYTWIVIPKAFNVKVYYLGVCTSAISRITITAKKRHERIIIIIIIISLMISFLDCYATYI